MILLHQQKGDLTIATAMQGKQLSAYKRECGIENVLLKLTAILLDISASFNVKFGLNEKQAVDLASYILREYWWLKYAELFVFAEGAKMGKYGKVYDRIDSAMIIEWLTAYDVERGYICEARSNEKEGGVQTEAQQIYEFVMAGLKKAYPEEKTYQKPVLTLQERLSDPEYRKFYHDYQIQKIKENVPES